METRLDPTFEQAENNPTDLNKFFERPVKIFSAQWDVGAPFEESFNPWTLFFLNRRVANRICNYKNLRCKLNVKFVINGNAFYYGRIMAAYTPLFKFSDVDTIDPLSINANIPLSQRLHLMLDPTESQGGMLQLPFVWPFNALDLIAGDVVNI